MKKIKIARVVTVPIAFVHIKSFISFLNEKEDVEVELISSDGEYIEKLKKEVHLDVTRLNILRNINLFKDLTSLINLIKYFKVSKFRIIHSSTPKAGLLCSIAGAFFPNIINIHTFTGQRWATSKGLFRILLKFLDRIIIRLNQTCYTDSPSQIDFLIEEGVAKKGELKCLNLGSYGGVNLKRFNSANRDSSRIETLKEVGGSTSDTLFVFVGRITKDKGVEELVEAFKKSLDNEPSARLLLVGPHENGINSVSSDCRKDIEAHPRIHSLGFKPNPEHYLSACDIFCLPSYREGFGTVVIEAAACGLMTIGTKIPGLSDSVVDGKTGILVEKENVQQLSHAMLKVFRDKEYRLSLSKNAKERAVKEFDSNLLSELQWKEYECLLKKHS